jgi:hypothetical protein
MLRSDGTFNVEGNASLNLVAAIRTLGFDVPEGITAESQVYHRISAARQTAEGEYDSAVSNLRLVPCRQIRRGQDWRSQRCVSLACGHARGRQRPDRRCGGEVE